MPYLDKEKAKIWREKNKESLAEYNKQYRQKNKKIINERNKKWREKNKEKKKEIDHAYNTSLRGRFNTTKGNAKRRNKIFTLTFEEFCKEIAAPCYYCNNQLGEKSTMGSGLDRLDNTKGYELGNVRSCCGSCNQIKGEILTPEETLAAIKAITDYRKQNK